MVKRKLKKKAFIYIILFILVVIAIALILMYFTVYKNYINVASGSYIITTKDVTLYNKNRNEIGTIKKNVKVNVSKKDGTYLKLADSNYYIKSSNIKIANNKTQKISNYYLPFNKDVETSNITKLYLNGKVAATLRNSVTKDILYMDKDYYYISIMGNIFGIKKDKTVKQKQSNNTKEEETTSISVINYNKIYSDNECSSITCIKDSTYLQHIKYLKDNGYYTIDLDTYEKYLNGYVRLKDKAILLTTGESNNVVEKLNKDNKLNLVVINEKSNLKFVNSDRVPNKDKNNLNRYNIKSSTSFDTFKKMINRENVVDPYPFEKNSNEQTIPVLNYHFFYDESKGEWCDEDICLDTSMFRKHLDYLKNNGYKTLTMEEFTEWMYGDIELPEKSVLITVDDGAAGTGKHNGNKLIPILEEYDMHATLFLITGWWDVENYRSKNLDIQSHTNDMHNRGSCGSGQVVCATRDELLNDLNNSLKIVDNNNSFCFPFYQYSDLSLKTVEEAGFKLSFIGGNRKAARSDNKYMIPRYPIHKSHSYEDFVRMMEE